MTEIHSMGDQVCNRNREWDRGRWGDGGDGEIGRYGDRERREGEKDRGTEGVSEGEGGKEGWGCERLLINHIDFCFVDSIHESVSPGGKREHVSGGPEVRAEVPAAVQGLRIPRGGARFFFRSNAGTTSQVCSSFSFLSFFLFSSIFLLFCYFLKLI